MTGPVFPPTRARALARLCMYTLLGMMRASTACQNRENQEYVTPGPLLCNLLLDLADDSTVDLGGKAQTAQRLPNVSLQRRNVAHHQGLARAFDRQLSRSTVSTAKLTGQTSLKQSSEGRVAVRYVPALLPLPKSANDVGQGRERLVNVDRLLQSVLVLPCSRAG